MLLKVVSIYIVYVHVFDVLHKVRFLLLFLLSFGFRLFLKYYSPTCPYIDFFPQLYIIISVFLLFDLSLYSIIIFHCPNHHLLLLRLWIVDICLQAILTQVNFFTFLLLDCPATTTIAIFFFITILFF